MSMEENKVCQINRFLICLPANNDQGTDIFVFPGGKFRALNYANSLEAAFESNYSKHKIAEVNFYSEQINSKGKYEFIRWVT